MFSEAGGNVTATRCRLSALRPGTRAVVRAILTDNQLLAGKLLSMGLVDGTHVTVSGRAPLGDPIEIYALHYRLALRLTEADAVEVETLE